MYTQTVINITPKELRGIIREELTEIINKQSLRVISKTEATKILGVSYNTIKNMIADGRIDAVRVGKKNKVTYSSLKRYLNG